VPKYALIPLCRIFRLLAFLLGFALPIVAVTEPRVSEAYGQLPLHFEANRGQTHEDVRFLSRGPGYTLYLTAVEAVLVLTTNADGRADLRSSQAQRDAPASAKSAVLRMSIVGAAPKPLVSGLDELPGKANYFIGNDRAKWRTSVPTYAKVHYRDVYPGIDLLYYGNQRQLEYDFVVARGADPKKIVLGFQGAERLEIDAQGELVLHAAGGAIHQRKPFIYQEIDGVRREIDGGYVLKGANRVGFQVAAYDSTRPLVIDPVLVYSTFLGGSDFELGSGIAVGSGGNAYVTGCTASLDFPTTSGAFQTVNAGGAGGGCGNVSDGADAFVTKLDLSGSALVYSTYLGGSGRDQASGIAVDPAGNAYVTGITESSDFPTTPAAFDPSFNGNADAFVTKLDATGAALVYSSFLGGGGFDFGFGIAVDSGGSAYVTGYTESANFPTTPAAFDPSLDGGLDAFVTKLDATGVSLVYSTFLGGSNYEWGYGIAVDSGGNAYITGQTSSVDFPTTPAAVDPSYNGDATCNGPSDCSIDAFVTKLDAMGVALIYSSFLGGSADDQGYGIALDSGGNAYVTGCTESPNFPTTFGAFQTVKGGGGGSCSNAWDSGDDAFVTKLDPLGSALVYSTYLGGNGNDQGFGIAVDLAGNAYVTGSTNSSNFPTTAGAIDTTLNGSDDAFVTKLNPTGSMLVYSTYLGSSGQDEGRGIALDIAGNSYVTGFTSSSDFPTTAGAVDTTFNGTVDVFVAKIGDIAAPATLVLMPAAFTNPVGTNHTVTATVRDSGGNPVPDIVVRFTVTGSVSTSGSCTTNANGQCTFTYMGPALPGSDVITAYADTDEDNTQDAGEPIGAATKTWLLPVTTPLCEIKISDGGRITALNGDTATFGGNARSSATGQTSGQQTYQDHGPAQPLTAKALSVLAIVCEGTMQASIYGQATINGSGSFFYRINLKDAAEPGVGSDTYWILLQNGYTSGQQTLEGGNVQIRRQ
jgi:hypothetical protein